MCGRFNVTSSPLSDVLLELVGMPHPGPDNYNAAPTETITVVRLNPEREPELVPMRWWLTPYWSKEMSTKYSMFNAKSETVAKSRAFREPFAKRRCVVPISGFYEWARQNNRKLPYYLTPHDAPGMLLAGIVLGVELVAWLAQGGRKRKRLAAFDPRSWICRCKTMYL